MLYPTIGRLPINFSIFSNASAMGKPSFKSILRSLWIFTEALGRSLGGDKVRCNFSLLNTRLPLITTAAIDSICALEMSKLVVSISKETSSFPW